MSSETHDKQHLCLSPFYVAIIFETGIFVKKGLLGLQFCGMGNPRAGQGHLGGLLWCCFSS